MTKPICAVIGVGPGNGAALARRFAAGGYTVALLARTTEFTANLAAELGDARAYACDVTDQGSVARAFASIRQDLGEVDALIYNAGSGTWGSVEDISVDDFDMSWRVNALGALVAAQQVIPAMKQKGEGQILFIGGHRLAPRWCQGGGIRPGQGGPAQPAEAMARHLWPLGIHVALVIIDGVVDLPKTRERMPDKPAEFFVKPEELADTAFMLTRQKRSAWSFEVEARPFGENW